MVTTRSGKTIKYKAEDYGRYYHIFGRAKFFKPRKVLTRSQLSKLPPRPTFQVPSSPVKERDVSRLRTSEEDPTCCDYGYNRRIEFPGYYFCSECDFWDLNSFDNNQIKRTSRNFHCRAEHESWIKPTHKLDLYNDVAVTRISRTRTFNSKNGKNYTVIDVDDSSSEDKLSDDEMSNNEFEENENLNLLLDQLSSLSIFNNALFEHNKELEASMKSIKETHLAFMEVKKTELEERNTRITEVEKENEMLIEKLNNAMKNSEKLYNLNQELVNKITSMKGTVIKLQKANYHLKKQSKDDSCECPNCKIHNLSTEEVTNKFLFNLDILSRHKNRQIKTMLEQVSKILFQPSIFDGELIAQLIRCCQEHYRQTIFSPQNLLKLMDQNGGQLSMTALSLLRTMDTNGNKYSRSSVFPSISTIQRTCAIVDRVAQQLAPFKEGVLSNGAEFAEFEVAPVVRLMLRGYGLEEAARTRSITINQAIDGARLTTRLHHTTFGLKMSDLAACDPSTGELIYGSSNTSTLQSKHYCHPIKIILSHETKEVIEEFRDVMNQVKELTIEDIAKSKLHGAKPITTYVNADMSAQWKLIQRGHGMKRSSGSSKPCHVCAIEDKNLEVPNVLRCRRWCNELHKDDPDWKCFHQNFLDEECVKEMKMELEMVKKDLHNVLEKLDKIQKKSKLNMKEDPRAPHSSLQFTDIKSIHFDLEKNKNKTTIISNYISAIKHDLKIRNMQTDGEHYECQERLRINLVQEFNYNRLLASLNHVNGFSNDKAYVLLAECPPCILHMEMRTTLKFLQILLDDGLREAMTDVGNYVTSVNNLFNMTIFGTTKRPYTFKVIYDASKKVIEDITLDGLRCRILLYKFQPLIELCVSSPERRNRWLFIIDNYIKAFTLLRKKDNLTDDEIKDFQYYVDLFFQEYMEMCSRKGITNYFHMLGSGHVADYLVKCGNLYIHSQQGWEAFNSFLKVYYFRRTTRGGGKGSENNRIKQLGRWLGRRLLWNSGYTFDEIITIDALGDVYEECNETFSDNSVVDKEDVYENTVHDEDRESDEQPDEFDPDFYMVENSSDTDDKGKNNKWCMFHEGADTCGCYNHCVTKRFCTSCSPKFYIQYGAFYKGCNSCIECFTLDMQQYFF